MRLERFALLIAGILAMTLIPRFVEDLSTAVALSYLAGGIHGVLLMATYIWDRFINVGNTGSGDGDRGSSD